MSAPVHLTPAEAELLALKAKVLEFEKASKGHLATTAARLADEMFAMAKGEKPSGREKW